MKDSLTVKELKEQLDKVPDNYVVLSRAENAHLDKDDVPWQLGFADVITKVKPVHKRRIVMLIRGFE